MSTFMAKKGSIERKWYILDAAGKPLGKTAATAAVLLRGKHKPEYTPHADCGDFVVIVNAEKAVLTGKKGEQKFYRTHSGYVGGLKEVTEHVQEQEALSLRHPPPEVLCGPRPPDPQRHRFYHHQRP